MVDSFDDAEFWLPPQFLTDEDFLMDGKSCTQRAAGGDGLCLGRGPGSGLSSLVDSPLGSLETESDEEDVMAELSRMMAHSTLEDGLGAADSKVTLTRGQRIFYFLPTFHSLFDQVFSGDSLFLIREFCF